MEVHVQHGARPMPFLRARDTFQTEFDLERPVKVFVRDDPDERTWTSHPGEHHHLNISRAAARGGMARELAMHEYAHMYRHEEGHPSHHLTTEEAIYLAAAGKRVSRDRLTQCYQIANHMKDIYADDLTVRVSPADKLVAFLESSLAGVVLDAQPRVAPAGETPISREGDPAIAAVNAAFALGLVERHDLVTADHRVYELARIVAADAPTVPFDRFRRLFGSLVEEPDESSYRRALVEAIRAYLGGTELAAD